MTFQNIHLRNSNTPRVNARDLPDSGIQGLSTGKTPFHGPLVKDRGAQDDRILEALARKDAAISLAAEDGRPSEQIRKAVETAGAAGDVRAALQQGERAAEAPPKPFKPLASAMGISSRTIFATILGTGSVACRRIPVSVSCLPNERNTAHG